MSATYSGIDGYVGNTPLIRLRRLSELTGCEILGKAEFMNRAGRRVGFVGTPPAGRSGYSKLRVMDGAHRRDYARTQATRLPLQLFNSCIVSGLYLGMAIFVVEQGRV